MSHRRFFRNRRDEKIYVDGESFPSHFGTGTEEYYGYAWCRPETFTGHPFIARPDGSGNFDPGYTSNVRFRSLDAISFKKLFKFDMEMWHWTKAIINFSPITFWYACPEDVENIPGSDLLDASFPVANEEMKSDIVIKFSKGPRYGTFKVSFNKQNYVVM